MPYIITTIAKYHPLAAESAENYHRSSVTVATLEEARGLMIDAYQEHGYLGNDRTHSLELASVLQPGTVGPLPDGTVIEVEQTTWDALAGVPTKAADEYAQHRILDAYNARQSVSTTKEAPA